MDVYISLLVKQSTNIPSFLDPVGDWLFQKVISPIRLKADAGLTTFEKIIVSEIPNFHELSWDAIFHLRESKYRKKCIKYLQQVPFDTTIQEHLKDSMWKLITEVKSESSVTKSALKGIIGNLPGLPINPLGIAISFNDSKNIKQRNDLFSWIYFLSEVRHTTIEKEEEYTLIPKNIRS